LVGAASAPQPYFSGVVDGGRKRVDCLFLTIRLPKKEKGKRKRKSDSTLQEERGCSA